jgi:hypothetical protein
MYIFDEQPTSQIGWETDIVISGSLGANREQPFALHSFDMPLKEYRICPDKRSTMYKRSQI